MGSNPCEALQPLAGWRFREGGAVPFTRQIISRASTDRLELLIEERLQPGSDRERIDRRIWNLFGERWAAL